MLGYRPFYVTAASPANYYTFLGDIQECQGTIAEDEADNVGRDPDKKKIYKTGYSSGGSVPKTEFTNDGQRNQKSYLTYCHKWLAMEELPDDKYNRGIFDRAFIYYFMKGEVDFNIKEIISDKDSKLYKELIHLRKLLLAFKLINYKHKFSEIRTNLTARDAELTHPLLRIFRGTECFEKIRASLSKVVLDKTTNKSNSIESIITETLRNLGENENNKGKEIIYFTNEELETIFKLISDAKDYGFDLAGNTFVLPNGTKISKYKIIQLLRSKFKAEPFRTNQDRGYKVYRKNIEKISKQYEVIEEIIVLDDKARIDNVVTEVTEMTEFKEATPSNSPNILTISTSNEDEDNDQHKHNNIKNIINNKTDRNVPTLDENNPLNNYNGKGNNDDSKKQDITPPNTSLNCVTSVTSVTAPLAQYPCFFCGSNYKTFIDFDMELHLIEFHKEKLLSLSIGGNIERKLEFVKAKSKQMVLNSVEPSDDDNDEDRRY